MTLELQLSDEEARLFAAHLAWHVRQLDAELGRADNREVRAALLAEIEQIRALRRRLAPVGEVEQIPNGPWSDQLTDGEGDPIGRPDLAGI